METTEQILFKAQQFWPKHESLPKFVFDQGKWYCDGYWEIAACGDTILEALYRYIQLYQLLPGEKWNIVSEYLSEFVKDPIGQITIESKF